MKNTLAIMTSLVESVLQEAAKKESKYKTTEVIKGIDLEIDEGNLLAIDTNPIEIKSYRTGKHQFLKDLARDNTQILINKIWQLPTERVEDVVVVKLPDTRTILPREKPIPKAKPATRWEQYAQLKGIQKKKKGRMIWDEDLKEWRPRWGYKKAHDEKRDWVLEVPQNADPYEDQFAKKLKEKKERVAKNELQRLRNIARNMKGKVPGVGLTPTDNPDKDQVSRALHHARKSTASVGQFTDSLPKEKPAKNLGKKRKFEPLTGDIGAEKKRALEILGKLQSSRPVLDTTRAVNQTLAQEDRRRSQDSNERKKGKGGKKGKGNISSQAGGKKARKAQGGKKVGSQGKKPGKRRKGK